MITDNETNTVYLAAGIRHFMPMARTLLEALYLEGIDTHFLRHTDSPKHIWVRDFMPIQLAEERYLRYRYSPDYLKNDPEYIPRYETIARGLRLKGRKTDLIIDGGNVVKLKDKVIMTDKVLKENPLYTEQELVKILEEEMECELCLIPWDRYEIFGHADGMVRPIEGDIVLMNNYIDIDRTLRERIRERLAAHGLHVEELHYDLPRPSRQSWSYLNFLQVCNLILVPALGIAEDRLALNQLRQFYPQYRIIPIPGCQEIVKEGGALNCISWTVREQPKESATETMP